MAMRAEKNSGGFEMEFKNLDYNILYLLSADCSRFGTTGPFEKDIVYIEFPDIPVESLRAELIAMHRAGLLVIHGDSRELSLTAKGVAKVESLRCCLKDLSNPLRPKAVGCCVQSG